MIRAAVLVLALAFVTAIPAAAQTPSSATLRVAMAGLAHGHADGFLNHIKDRHDVELVGIAEPDKSIFDHGPPSSSTREGGVTLRNDRLRWRG